MQSCPLPSSFGSERATVQNPLVGYAGEIGCAYLTPDQALTLRRSESGTLFYQTLRDKLISLNPGILNVSNVEEVIGKIESVRNNIEGNAETLAWLRGERSIYIAAEKRQRNVKLIDFEHPTDNVFHVSDEWRYTNGKYANRADVAFLDTMSQAAPTPCMKVPTSETTSAISKLRKVDDRRGRQRLPDASLVEIAFAIRLVSPRYQHLLAVEEPLSDPR